MEDTEYVDVGAEVESGKATDPKRADEWKFLMGTALSVYQNAGGINTNWSTFEQRKNWLGQPVIEVGFHGIAVPFGCSPASTDRALHCLSVHMLWRRGCSSLRHFNVFA